MRIDRAADPKKGRRAGGLPTRCLPTSPARIDFIDGDRPGHGPVATVSAIQNFDELECAVRMVFVPVPG
jgi:hypothetical protein